MVPSDEADSLLTEHGEHLFPADSRVVSQEIVQAVACLQVVDQRLDWLRDVSDCTMLRAFMG